MKVKNMTSSSGNKVTNQFIINDEKLKTITFQSYSSVIAVIDSAGKVFDHAPRKVYLDKNKWDYSVTTGKYRNQFLGETKKETQAKIDSGEYKLVNLN